MAGDGRCGPPPGPELVEVVTDHGRVRCLVIEDPELTRAGLRQFWAEPITPVRSADGEVALYCDVLPPRSEVQIRGGNLAYLSLPCPPGCRVCQKKGR